MLMLSLIFPPITLSILLYVKLIQKHNTPHINIQIAVPNEPSSLISIKLIFMILKILSIKPYILMYSSLNLKPTIIPKTEINILTADTAGLICNNTKIINHETIVSLNIL